MNTKSALLVHEQRKTDRRNWDNIFDEISYYVIPSQTGFITKWIEGEKFRWSQRYDSTAVQACGILANHIHMALMSPMSEWFEYAMRKYELNRLDKVKEWLEDCANRTYFAINQSNFHGVINTQEKINCALGISGVEANYDIKNGSFRLVFQGIPLQDTTFDIDAQGKIDTKVTEYLYSKRHMKELFDMDVEKDDNRVYKITRPNPDYDPDSLNPEAREFIVEWCDKDKKVFKSETAYEQPFMAWRFNEAAGEPIYGESPALICLSDIRTLNRAKELELRGYEKAIDPPLMAASNGVIGDLHINAGGLTEVRNPSMIGELPGRMNYDIVLSKGEELRESILKAFKVDELLVPERKGQNPATATEIQVRFEQSQKSLGSTVGRIQDELLTPLIRRVFGMMYRNGQFKPMPPELRGEEMDIAFIGPLARSQTSNDAVAIERILSVTPAMAEMFPAVRHTLDGEKAYRRLVNQYAVPADVVRSEAEATREAKKEEQARAQAHQLEKQQMESEIADNNASAAAKQAQTMQLVQ